MPHTLKLGYIDDPAVGTDDCVDLAAGAAAGGYSLLGLDFGEPYDSPALGPGRQVRKITVSLEVTDTAGSLDTAITRMRRLQRYVEATRSHFARFGGNLPARSDLQHQKYLAAVLTWKSGAASTKMYFDIYDGAVQVDSASQVNPLSLAATIRVRLVLVVDALARGTRRHLNNLVAMGDFMPPFTLSATFPSLQAGWAFTGTWTRVAGTAKWGYYSLTASTAGATAATNEATDFTSGSSLLPQISYYVSSISGGTFSVVFQYYDSSTSTWVTQQTLVSATAAAAGWVTATGTNYSPGSINYNRVRLLVTMPSAGSTVYINGAAIYKDYAGDSPPVEYVTGGRKVGVPALNVYNVQGDVNVPLSLLVENRSAVSQRGVLVGSAFNSNPYYEFPVYDLDIRADNSTTAAGSLLWGTLPATSSGAAATSSYSANFAHLQNTTNGHNVDRLPRLYRAFLMYAANDSALITAVQVTLGNEVKTYSLALPQTYTGTANAAAGDFRLYDLGDFLFARPGNQWADQSGVEADSLTAFPGVVLSHSTSANRRTAVGGVLLVPQQMAGSIDLGSASLFGGSSYMFIFGSEGQTAKAGIGLAGSSTPYFEVNSFASAGIGKGGDFDLAPNTTAGGTATAPRYSFQRFSFLMFRDRNAADDRLYTFDATDAYSAAVKYTPRYLLGGV